MLHVRRAHALHLAVREARWGLTTRALELVTAHAAGVKGLIWPVLRAAAWIGVSTWEGRLADIGWEGGKLVVVEVNNSSTRRYVRHGPRQGVVPHINDLKPLEPADDIEGATQLVEG